MRASSGRTVNVIKGRLTLFNTHSFCNVNDGVGVRHHVKKSCSTVGTCMESNDT